jgi:hypothetical protein
MRRTGSGTPNFEVIQDDLFPHLADEELDEGDPLSANDRSDAQLTGREMPDSLREQHRVAQRELGALVEGRQLRYEAFADPVNEFRRARVRKDEPAVEAACTSAMHQPTPLGAELTPDVERMQLNLGQIECCFFHLWLSPETPYT